MKFEATKKINVEGNKRKKAEVFEAEKKTNEIKTLLKHEYIKEVKKNDESN